MLVGSMVEQAIAKGTSLQDGAALLWAHPQVCSELSEMLGILRGQIQHVGLPLVDSPAVPLTIRARYTRIEILAAFGVGEGAKTMLWQSGVYWAKDARADLLAFTLDKTSGQFSPTTRYRDYAVSPELIHWESQSGTRSDSDTGRRYQHHQENQSAIMLFVRHRTDERAFYFLGPAHYVKHESEQPMAITWRLVHRLPGDLFANLAAAVA